jgi:phosphopantetheinyl transferase
MVIFDTSIFPSESDVVCMSISTTNSDDVTQYLSDAERVFASRKRNHRDTWILGRVAVKQALNTRLCARGYRPISPCMLTILPDLNGRPTVVYSGEDNRYRVIEEWSISISHNDTYVIAVVLSDSRYSIGIDIETIRHFHTDTKVNFLTSSEYAFTIGATDDLLTTAYWSLKESYLKSIGMGLRIHPRRIQIVRPLDRMNVSEVLHDGEKAPAMLKWTIVDDRYIISNTIV